MILFFLEKYKRKLNIIKFVCIFKLFSFYINEIKQVINKSNLIIFNLFFIFTFFSFKFSRIKQSLMDDIKIVRFH